MFATLLGAVGGSLSGLVGDSLGMGNAGSPIFEASQKAGELAGQGITMAVGTSPIGKAVAGMVMPGATAAAGAVEGGAGADTKPTEKKTSFMDDIGSGAKDLAAGAAKGIMASDPVLGSMTQSFTGGSPTSQSSNSEKMGYAVGSGDDDDVEIIPFNQLMQQNIRR